MLYMFIYKYNTQFSRSVVSDSLQPHESSTILDAYNFQIYKYSYIRNASMLKNFIKSAQSKLFGDQ